MNVQVGLADFEGLGVRRVANPLQHVLVFRVLWIRDHLKIMGVAVDAADVLRRAGSFSRFDDWIFLVIARWKDRLQDHVVFPAQMPRFVPICTRNNDMRLQ